MKWFRHYTNANQDEGLRKLANSMGMEGVGIWWTLLEIIAAKMDESDRCHATYSVSDWCSFLKVKQKKLSLFLVLTEFELGIKSVRSDNELRIECRNLLKYRDEYTRKSGQTPDKNPPQSQSQIQNQKQKQNQPPPTPPAGSTVLDTAGGGGGEDFCSVGAEVSKIVGAWSNNGHNPTVTALDVLQGRAPAPVEVKIDRTQDKATFLAEKDAEVKRIAAEARERYRAEREAENKHLTQKNERDAVTWADEFAELVPKCSDQDKAEIYSAIKKIHNFEMLPTIFQDVKNGVESGQFRNPKGIIIYRLKHAP